MGGFSCEVNGSELTIHNGMTMIIVRAGDVARLAQACSQALNNQTGKSAQKSTIF